MSEKKSEGKAKLVDLKGLKILENPKVLNGIIIGGLIIIALIFFGDFLFPKNEPAQTTTKADENIALLEKQLEDRLIKVLSGIEGIGDVEIMVTLDSTTEYVFAQDSKWQSEENATDKKQYSMEENYIFVEGVSGKKEALVKTIIQPKVRGVVVRCENGANPYIQEKVIDAVSKAYGINTARISVVN